MTFKELMAEKGFSQTRLSKVSKVCQSNLSIYSNYREMLVSSSVISRMRISAALEMSLEEFEEILDLKPSKILATSKQEGNYTVIENREPI